MVFVCKVRALLPPLGSRRDDPVREHHTESILENAEGTRCEGLVLFLLEPGGRRRGII